MEFGCHLPVFGPGANRETLLGFARRAEALGYDSLWVSDHVVVPWEIRSRYPYSPTGDFPLPPTENFLEPLTTLAMVAAVTERIRIGTSVLILPHRHPLLAAKMASTLDHLAPGRVVLGVGVGWMREEIELLGVPYEQRGAWSDEAIRVMRACWSGGDRVSFSGRFFRFSSLGMRPAPARGTIPIWIGGHSPRALRRTAELGDGWHGAFPTPAGMEEAIGGLREACRRAGRDFATLTISARVGLSARRPAADLIAELQGYRALGVQHVILESRMRNLEEMAELYDRFAREVKAKV